MKLLVTNRSRLTLCVLLGAGVAACDSASAPPVPVAAVVVAGDAQSGVAGLALAVRPMLRVEDARGKGVASVPVVFAVVEGGGRVEIDSVETDRDGEASPGAWTLGPQVGANALVAMAAGLPAVRFTAESSPGAPAVLRVQAGGDQSVTVGEQVAVPPAVLVLDANENPVPGAPVTFTVTAGDGLVGGASSVTLATSEDGLASPASWQLGPGAGPNTVEARVAGLPIAATFVATGEPGPAAALVPVAGATQTATVGTSVAVAPAVTVEDAYGNVVPGADVIFSVVIGNGDVTGADGTTSSSPVTVQSDSAGIARLGGWRLGTRAGDNGLEADVPGLGTVVRFSAIGSPGPAHDVEIVAGDGQGALAGTRLPVAPAVRVSDEWGNPVPGLLVTFEITAGGGALAGALQTTGSDGIAAVGSWDIGATAGLNSLQATPAGLAPVSFTAIGIMPSGDSGGSGDTGDPGTGQGTPGNFDVELRYTTPVSASRMAAFDAAADRWSGIITGDLPDVFVSLAADGCGVPHPAVNETVDDVLVFITVTEIDGPGQILGSAGPCRVRASGLPAVGIIYLDVDDIGSLQSSGLLTDVVIHEMGHVLGIGTLWPGSLTTGMGGDDPVFTGASAVAQFIAAGSYDYHGTPVPIENTGGSGTRYVHWRESVMGNELMTGWINYGGNPLSGVTVGSLGDMGYEVDLDAADSWAATPISALESGTVNGFEIREGVLPPPIVIGGSDATAAASVRTTGRSPGSTPR